MAEKYGISEVDSQCGQKNAEAKKFNDDNGADLHLRISKPSIKMPASLSLQSIRGKPVGIIILCVLWAIGGLFFIYVMSKNLMPLIDYAFSYYGDIIYQVYVFLAAGIIVLGIIMLIAVYGFWSRRAWSKKLGIASPFVIMILSIVTIVTIIFELMGYGYSISEALPYILEFPLQRWWEHTITHVAIAFVYVLIGIIIFRRNSVKDFFAGQYAIKKPKISQDIPVIPTPSTLSSIACPKCGFDNVKGKKFCSQCGEKLKVTKFCPECGHKNKEGTKFCRNCGKALIEKKRFCMHCGHKMPFTAKRCPKCHKSPRGGVDTKGCRNCNAVIPVVAGFCSECGASQPK